MLPLQTDNFFSVYNISNFCNIMGDKTESYGMTVLPDKATADFIAAHRNDDVRTLAFKRAEGVDMTDRKSVV